MTQPPNPDTIDWQKCDGLVPAIVQHADSGAVLMLGYMNREALAQTLSSRRVTFYSRSRGALWVKGQTSGNALDLVDAALDCDGDTLLLLARPLGPTCHRGSATCFDRSPADPAPAPRPGRPEPRADAGRGAAARRGWRRSWRSHDRQKSASKRTPWASGSSRE